jgi:hypothetical protein
MKTPSLKTMFRMVGILLLLPAGFFLLLCFGFTLAAKGGSISSAVGAALPLLTLLLFALAVYFLAGAPHLVRVFGQRH